MTDWAAMPLQPIRSLRPAPVDGDALVERLRLTAVSVGYALAMAPALALGIVSILCIPLGLLASLATVVPFGVARHEGVVPDGQLWLPALVAAGVVALTLLSARSAVRRAAASIGGVR